MIRKINNKTDYNNVYRGPLDIPDPLHFTDPMGYEKCVSMCKKSIENLVTLLEQKEEAEAKKRPKIIKLADPPIFTITSPSQWQRNNLKSPDVSAPFSWPPAPPPSCPAPCPAQPAMEPPQDVPDCSDLHNQPPRNPVKIFSERERETELSLIIIPTKHEPPSRVIQFRDVPPQPPECQIEDNEWRPSFRLKHFDEKVLSDPPSVAVMPPCQTNVIVEETGAPALSPPQPPPVEIEDTANNLNNINKYQTEIVDLQLEVFFPSVTQETCRVTELCLSSDLQRPEVDIVDTVNNQRTGCSPTDRRVQHEITDILPFSPLNFGLEIGKIMIVGISSDLQAPNVDVDDIVNYPNPKIKTIQENIKTIEIIHQFPALPHKLLHSDIFNMSSTDLQRPDIFINDTANLTKANVKDISGCDFADSASQSITIPTSLRSDKGNSAAALTLPDILIRFIGNYGSQK